MEPPRLTAVVCSFYQQFINWCRDQGINPRDPSLCLVQREDQARGRLFDDMAVVGESPWQLTAVVRSRLRREVTG